MVRLTLKIHTCFYQHLHRKGYYLHACRCISLTWNGKKPLRVNLKDKITQRLKTRKHPNSDFANRQVNHINIFSLSRRLGNYLAVGTIWFIWIKCNIYRTTLEAIHREEKCAKFQAEKKLVKEKRDKGAPWEWRVGQIKVLICCHHNYTGRLDCIGYCSNRNEIKFNSAAEKSTSWRG